MLATTEKGGVRNSIKNCLMVFQHDPLLSGAIAYNLLTDRTDVVKPIGYDRSPSASMTDTDMKYIRLYLEENYDLTSEKKIIDAADLAAHQNSYHPVRDYLNSLTWDGTERIHFCLHHFLGCDLERVYEELEARFPDIFFVRCYMDPIMQKHGLTPDQKLRKAIYDGLKMREENPKAVTILGSDFALDETSDIRRLLKWKHIEVKELPECNSWKSYQELADSKIFIACYPPGKYGLECQAERLRKKALYLPGSFDYDEIIRQWKTLEQAVGENVEEVEGIEDTDMHMEKSLKRITKREIALCESALEQARKVVGDVPIMIDHTFHPRPLELAKLLLTHGFSVTRIYLDAVNPEEKDTFEWLKEQYPELEYEPTIRPEMRMKPRNESDVLAIGQKAAWFTGTRHFVNLVEGAGLYGFDGIRRTAELMTEAWQEEKDPEDLIIRKGWGCESCI